MLCDSEYVLTLLTTRSTFNITIHEKYVSEHVRIPRTSCKHVLAAALSNSICRHLTTDDEREKVVKVLSVTEETYLEMISNMD